MHQSLGLYTEAQAKTHTRTGDGTLTAAEIARVVADVRRSDIVYADGDETNAKQSRRGSSIFDSSLENVTTRRIANITAGQSSEKLNVWRSNTHAGKMEIENIPPP